MPTSGNNKSNGLLHRLERFLTRGRSIAATDRPGEMFVTGPELVARIVDAIRHGQSVVLEGPRGCGKSRCVRDAIDQAVREGSIVEGAKRMLQGNREIPRDYLIEDETVFQHRGGKVVPERRSAPLFTFAVRDESGRPKTDASGKVVCRLRPEEPESPTNPKLEKFVLFLDEINRFSDGVLDSLLLVLEEGSAVMAGMEWRLPVTVLMTMNPPGYDSTARRLSAPLAARISRTYRLGTPDLDTLCDRIVAKRLDDTRHDFGARNETFPECPPELLRRACMVTLCLWGNPGREGASARSALYCLTPETRDLIRRLVAANADLKSQVEKMETLCAYGPDGRAAGDWITAAIGYAVREEATRQTGERPVLKVEHLQKTLIETIAGKIYDSFSPASSPDKTQEKQDSLKAIARHVLNMKLDDPADADRVTLTRRIDGRSLVADFPRTIESPSNETIRELFVLCQVTTNGEYARWSSVARIESRSRQSLYNGFVARKIIVVSNEAGDSRQAIDTSLESNSPLPVHFRKEAPVWAKPAWRLLAQVFAGEVPDTNADVKRLREISRTVNPDLQSQMKGILQIVRDAVEPIEGVLAQYESVRRITVAGFVAVCEKRRVGKRADQLKVAETLEDLWCSREPNALAAPLEPCLGEAIAQLLPHVPSGRSYRELRKSLETRIKTSAPSPGTGNR